MANIETQDNLTSAQVSELLKWFDKTIGTDREVNPSTSGRPGDFYIVFMDMEGGESWRVERHLKALGLEYYYI